MTNVLTRSWKAENSHIDTEGEAISRQRQRAEGWVYKPRGTKGCREPTGAAKQVWNNSPQSFQKDPPLLTAWFWTSGLQNYERIHFFKFAVFAGGRPRKRNLLLSVGSPFRADLHCRGPSWLQPQPSQAGPHLATGRVGYLSPRQLWRAAFSSELPPGEASPISSHPGLCPPPPLHVYGSWENIPLPTFCLSICFQGTQPAMKKKCTPLALLRSYYGALPQVLPLSGWPSDSSKYRCWCCYNKKVSSPISRLCKPVFSVFVSVNSKHRNRFGAEPYLFLGNIHPCVRELTGRNKTPSISYR